MLERNIPKKQTPTRQLLGDYNFLKLFFTLSFFFFLFLIITFQPSFSAIKLSNFLQAILYITNVSSIFIEMSANLIKIYTQQGCTRSSCLL